MLFREGTASMLLLNTLRLQHLTRISPPNTTGTREEMYWGKERAIQKQGLQIFGSRCYVSSCATKTVAREHTVEVLPNLEINTSSFSFSIPLTLKPILCQFNCRIISPDSVMSREGSKPHLAGAWDTMGRWIRRVQYIIGYIFLLLITYYWMVFMIPPFCNG